MDFGISPFTSQSAGSVPVTPAAPKPAPAPRRKTGGGLSAALNPATLFGEPAAAAEMPATQPSEPFQMLPAEAGQVARASLQVPVSIATKLQEMGYDDETISIFSRQSYEPVRKRIDDISRSDMDPTQKIRQVSQLARQLLDPLREAGMTDDELAAVYKDVAGPAITTQAVGRAQAGIQTAKQEAYRTLPGIAKAGLAFQEGLFGSGVITGGLGAAGRAAGIVPQPMSRVAGDDIYKDSRLGVARGIGTAIGMGADLIPIGRLVSGTVKLGGMTLGALAKSPAMMQRIGGLVTSGGISMGAQNLLNGLFQDATNPEPGMTVRESLGKTPAGQRLLDALGAGAIGAGFSVIPGAVAGLKFFDQPIKDASAKAVVDTVANFLGMEAIAIAEGRDLTPDEIGMILAPTVQKGFEIGAKAARAQKAAPKPAPVTRADREAAVKAEVTRVADRIKNGEKISRNDAAFEKALEDAGGDIDAAAKAVTDTLQSSNDKTSVGLRNKIDAQVKSSRTPTAATINPAEVFKEYEDLISQDPNAQDGIDAFYTESNQGGINSRIADTSALSNLATTGVGRFFKGGSQDLAAARLAEAMAAYRKKAGPTAAPAATAPGTTPPPTTPPGATAPTRDLPRAQQIQTFEDLIEAARRVAPTDVNARQAIEDAMDRIHDDGVARGADMLQLSQDVNKVLDALNEAVPPGSRPYDPMTGDAGAAGPAAPAPAPEPEPFMSSGERKQILDSFYGQASRLRVDSPEAARLLEAAQEMVDNGTISPMEFGSIQNRFRPEVGGATYDQLRTRVDTEDVARDDIRKDIEQDIQESARSGRISSNEQDLLLQQLRANQPNPKIRALTGYQLLSELTKRSRDSLDYQDFVAEARRRVEAGIDTNVLTSQTVGEAISKAKGKRQFEAVASVAEQLADAIDSADLNNATVRAEINRRLEEAVRRRTLSSVDADRLRDRLRAREQAATRGTLKVGRAAELLQQFGNDPKFKPRELSPADQSELRAALNELNSRDPKGAMDLLERRKALDEFYAQQLAVRDRRLAQLQTALQGNISADQRRQLQEEAARLQQAAQEEARKSGGAGLRQRIQEGTRESQERSAEQRRLDALLRRLDETLPLPGVRGITETAREGAQRRAGKMAERIRTYLERETPEADQAAEAPSPAETVVEPFAIKSFADLDTARAYAQNYPGVKIFSVSRPPRKGEPAGKTYIVTNQEKATNADGTKEYKSAKLVEEIPLSPSEGEAATPEQTAATVEEVLAEAGVTRANLAAVDPNVIQVDAETYQFKSGSDTQGVTERLRGVQEWDPLFAGIILLHRRADGSLYVANGHQRLGLARRLLAAGKEVPSLNAFILNEADGYSVGAVRRIASLVNVAEGTGTAIDIAKILREGPLTDVERSRIPSSGTKIRAGENIAKLGDEAFSLVINEAIPENQADIVGKLVVDPGQQVAVIKALAQAEPANLYQAEMMVRDLLSAGFREVEQMGLFGAMNDVVSVAKQKAQVMDTLRRDLNSEKSALGNAIRNEARLAEQGNVLAREANIAGLEQSQAVSRLLEIEFNKTGPFADVLNEAARQYAAGTINRQQAAALARTALEGVLSDLTKPQPHLEVAPSGEPTAPLSGIIQYDLFGNPIPVEQTVHAEADAVELGAKTREQAYMDNPERSDDLKALLEDRVQVPDEKVISALQEELATEFNKLMSPTARAPITGPASVFQHIASNLTTYLNTVDTTKIPTFKASDIVDLVRKLNASTDYRIQKIYQNAIMKKTLPVIKEYFKNSPIGKYITDVYVVSDALGDPNILVDFIHPNHPTKKITLKFGRSFGNPNANILYYNYSINLNHGKSLLSTSNGFFNPDQTVLIEQPDRVIGVDARTGENVLISSSIQTKSSSYGSSAKIIVRVGVPGDSHELILEPKLDSNSFDADWAVQKLPRIATQLGIDPVKLRNDVLGEYMTMSSVLNNKTNPWDTAKSNLIISKGTDARIAKSIKRVFNLFGIKRRTIFITNDELKRGDGYNKYGLTGDLIGLNLPTSSNNAFVHTAIINGVEHSVITLDTAIDGTRYWSTLGHEVGHVIFDEALRTAPEPIRKMLWAAFKASVRRLSPAGPETFIRQVRPPELTEDLLAAGRTPEDIQRSAEYVGYVAPGKAEPMGDLPSGDRAELRTYSEWFADQVSRFFIADARVQNTLDRYFKSVADKIKQLYYTLKGESMIRPDETVESFLSEIIRVNWHAARGRNVQMDHTRIKPASNELPSVIQYNKYRRDGVEKNHPGHYKKMLRELAQNVVNDAEGKRKLVKIVMGMVRDGDMNIADYQEILDLMKGTVTDPSIPQFRPEEVSQKFEVLNRDWTDLSLPDDIIAESYGKKVQTPTQMEQPGFTQPITGVQGLTEPGAVSAKYSPLEESILNAPKLEYNPQDTSVPQEPLAITQGFKRGYIQPGTINLDIGGGKYDKGTDYLREQGIENILIDPYAREREFNLQNLARLKEVAPKGADSVTLSSVLNVIREPEIQKSVLMQAYDSVKSNGQVIIAIYEGDGTGAGRVTGRNTFQHNRKTVDYMPIVESIFGAGNVTRKGNLIVATRRARGPIGGVTMGVFGAPGAIPLPDTVMKAAEAATKVFQHFLKTSVEGTKSFGVREEVTLEDGTKRWVNPVAEAAQAFASARNQVIFAADDFTKRVTGNLNSEQYDLFGRYLVHLRREAVIRRIRNEQAIRRAVYRRLLADPKLSKKARALQAAYREELKKYALRGSESEDPNAVTIPSLSAEELKRVESDPDIQESLNVYRTEIAPELQKMREFLGLQSLQDVEGDVFVRLKALRPGDRAVAGRVEGNPDVVTEAGEEQIFRGGGVTPTSRERIKGTNRTAAFGTGELYETDFETLMEHALQRDLYNYRKEEFINTLVDKGIARAIDVRARVPNTIMVNGQEVPAGVIDVAMPELAVEEVTGNFVDTDIVPSLGPSGPGYVRTGRVSPTGPRVTRYLVPKEVKNEYENLVQRIDEPLPEGALKHLQQIRDSVTKLQLAFPVEASAHAWRVGNILSALPVASDARGRFLKTFIPYFGARAQAMRELYNVDMSRNSDDVKLMRRLAKLGAIPSRSIKDMHNLEAMGELNLAARGLNWAAERIGSIPGSQALREFVFSMPTEEGKGFSGMDIRARLAAAKLYLKTNPTATDVELADFANQFGNYTADLQTKYVRNAKKFGFSFAGFQSQAIPTELARYLGYHGMRVDNLSLPEQRALMAQTIWSNALGTAVAVSMWNFAVTGQWPWEDPTLKPGEVVLPINAGESRRAVIPAGAINPVAARAGAWYGIPQGGYQAAQRAQFMRVDIPRLMEYAAQGTLQGVENAAFSTAGPFPRALFGTLLGKMLYLNREGEFADLVERGQGISGRVAEIIPRLSPFAETMREGFEILTESPEARRKNVRRAESTGLNFATLLSNMYNPIKIEFRPSQQIGMAKMQKETGRETRDIRRYQAKSAREFEANRLWQLISPQDTTTPVATEDI